MATKDHIVYESPNDIPYLYISNLGRGSHGTVEEVCSSTNGKIYARKSIAMPRISPTHSEKSRSENEKKIQRIKEEARIIRRLKHQHVVRVEFTYENPNAPKPTFCILLLPVASKDLNEILNEMDQLTPGEEKDELIRTMGCWAGCLVRAMDYIHAMKVKHKDIKPANILVASNKVYIADFGIAKEIDVDGTTGSENIEGSRTWISPESLEFKRRGRSSDIFSLGCCLLEMATVMITNGGLAALKGYRRGPYAENPDRVLKWIHYLTSLLVMQKRASSVMAEEDAAFQHAAMLPALVFVMMDPHPKSRITARQLVAMIWRFASTLFCEDCAMGVTNDPNIPLHSTFKQGRDIFYPVNPKDALEPNTSIDWETAKRMWLREHVWW